MSAPIVPVSLANLAAIQPPTISALPVDASAGHLFHEMFQSAVNTVEGFQSEASGAIQNLLSGRNEDPHTAVLASQRADLTFEMFMQVRNKVMGAYQEIMKMQV